MAEFGRQENVGEKEGEQVARPKPGLVRNVCRQWVVHEDEGLAHRLQEEEFQSHFGHNKKERTIVRGDIKEAKRAQTEEEAETERQHLRHLQQLEALERRDQALAERLQQKLSQDAKPASADFFDDDEVLALRLQEEEEEAAQAAYASPGPSGVWKAQVASPQRIYERLPSRKPSLPHVDRNVVSMPHSSVSHEDSRRTLQEKKDEELARQLQAMEEQESLASRDYQLAVESQDAEYARMIDEKERDRLRKLKDRYKAKKEANLSFEDEMALEQANVTPRYHPTPPSTSPRIVQDLTNNFGNSSISARKTLSLDRQERTVPIRQVAQERSSVNVATLIDPTYIPSTSSSRQVVDRSNSNEALTPSLATSYRNPTSSSAGSTATPLHKSISSDVDNRQKRW